MEETGHKGLAASPGAKAQRKYGYPPDKQEKATQMVLEQAEALSQAWATD
jgi:hypothetical protein